MPYKDPERQRQYRKRYALKNKEKIKKYNEIYNQRPEVKKRSQEREQRPEVIEKRKQYGQTEKRYFNLLFNKIKNVLKPIKINGVVNLSLKMRRI